MEGVDVNLLLFSLSALLNFISWLWCCQNQCCQCWIHRLSVDQQKHFDEQIDKSAFRRWDLKQCFSHFHLFYSAAVYKFIILITISGQVLYNNAVIQILNLLSIIQGIKDNKSCEWQIITVAKTYHFIFIVLNVNKSLTDKKIIKNKLKGFGICINKKPLNIVFKKKNKRGINIINTVPLFHIDYDICQGLSESGYQYRYHG